MERETEIVRHLRMQPFTREEIDAVKAGIVEGSAPERGAATRFFPQRMGFYAMAVLGVLGIVGIKYIPGVTGKESFSNPQTYVAAAGQRATFDLPDGSHVILAPQSRLQLTSERQVSLRGEAYFEVSAHNKNAFIVTTSRAVTKVLGTAFSVRALSNENTERVIVASGKVSVSGSHKNAPPEVLIGSMLAQLGPDGSIQVMRGQDTGDLLGWTAGRLVFRNITAEQMLLELSRWYAVNMKLADKSQGSRLVTASISTSKSPEQVSQIVGYMLGATAERNGNTITFTKQE